MILAPSETPENFWDPCIVELDKNDPRNLTQLFQPFQTRVIIIRFISMPKKQCLSSNHMNVIQVEVIYHITSCIIHELHKNS